jgi:hypothetical protein
MHETWKRRTDVASGLRPDVAPGFQPGGHAVLSSSAFDCLRRDTGGKDAADYGSRDGLPLLSPVAGL